MKLKSKEDVEMMDIRSIEDGGDRILIKGKMMGAMATTIVVTPTAIWDAFRLCPWRIFLRLPALFFRGWRLSRKIQPDQPRKRL